MNAETLDRIVEEIGRELTGRRVGKVFQLSAFELGVDLRSSGTRFLYLNFSPGSPRLYLIRRKLRELERRSVNPTPFLASMRKHLSDAEVRSISRVQNERVIRIGLTGTGETGIPAEVVLAAQLTGRSSNLFILDGADIVIDRARATDGVGQTIGDKYQPPKRTTAVESQIGPGPDDIAVMSSSNDASEALDEFYGNLSAEQAFTSLVDAARKKNRAERKKIEHLREKLNADLARHGDPEGWKRSADLLLANVSSGRREGGLIYVTDYFDERQPEVPIEADSGLSISEAAENYYRLYTRARNAGREIGARLKEVKSAIANLESAAAAIEREAAAGNAAFFERSGTGSAHERSPRSVKKAGIYSSSYRTFVSSDGFEILVGKKAADNDTLTLKVARSLDTWLHAADYPGSHVVVRHAGQKELPHRTLIEAAKLAAFYSQGRSQPKAAVHYTQKKFVSKPKGWAPGLVRLASFKTVLVEPDVPKLERR